MIIGTASILTALAALVAVLLLVWLAARAARFSGLTRQPAGGRTLAVEEVIALDMRRRLHLVRCGQRRVILLTGGAQDVVVGWLERRETPE